MQEGGNFDTVVVVVVVAVSVVDVVPAIDSFVPQVRNTQIAGETSFCWLIMLLLCSFFVCDLLRYRTIYFACIRVLACSTRSHEILTATIPQLYVIEATTKAIDT